jgi:hypothetical protein
MQSQHPAQPQNQPQDCAKQKGFHQPITDMLRPGTPNFIPYSAYQKFTAMDK